MSEPKVRSLNFSKANRVVAAFFVLVGDRQDKLSKHQHDDGVATDRGSDGGLATDKVNSDNVFFLASAERIDCVMGVARARLERQAGSPGGNEVSGVNRHGGPI